MIVFHFCYCFFFHLKRFQDIYLSQQTKCRCIQVSREQAWQTTAHSPRINGRYEQLCWGSTDGATGVKQLSALAARGEKMLLNQEGFSKQPLAAGQLKAQGSKVAVSSNGGHLFGCHGSTGEPWVGDQASQNISPGMKKNSTTGSISGMSTTHGHSLTTHVTTTRVYPYSTPVFTLLCLLCSSVSEGCPRKNAEAERRRKNLKEQPWPASARSSVLVFVRMSQGRAFFFCFVLFFAFFVLVEGDTRAAPVLQVPPDW